MIIDDKEMNSQENKQFKFSFVLSVYKVEEYIEEAVESIICQTIGFKDNVQLVFVDDGSPDASGAICDKYKEKYPENVIVLHKENEGLAMARKDGLSLATGEYVTFFDPDDILSPNTLKNVNKFFEKHGDEVDIVAIPIYMFGTAYGEHPLNTKFSGGSRVIDLDKDWKSVQMSMATAFFRRKALEGLEADPELVTAEDAKELIKLLLPRRRLGVVKEAGYRYRKRDDSQVGGARKRAGWYLTYVEHFSEWAMNYCLEKVGYVPKFVQYTVLYDLQWKYRMQQINGVDLTEEEIEAYRERVFDIAKHFDLDVIMEQSSIFIDHKLYLAYRKFGKSPTVSRVMGKPQCYFSYGSTLMFRVNDLVTYLQFIKISDGVMTVEGMQTYPSVGLPEPDILLLVGNKRYQCSKNGYDEPILSVGLEIGRRIGFICKIPLAELPEGELKVQVLMFIDNELSCQNRVVYGKYMPVSTKLRTSYYFKDGYILTSASNGFSVKRVNKREKNKKEKALRRELWHAGLQGKKAVIARIAVKLAKKLMPDDIWLITDKADRADDNGEAFFTFLAQNKSEVKCHPVFAISPKSVDYKRIKRIGKVVPYMSWRHKLLHLIAAHTVSAYSHDEISQPFMEYFHYYCDLAQENKIVFLQHGITKDDVSRGLNRRHKNFSLFVTSTERERESVLYYNYGYSEEQVVLTGLPRYDRLYDAPKKYVTLMPTWERSLFGKYDPLTSAWELLPGFEESAWYQFYISVLNSDRLHAAAEKQGYKIRIMPHPVFFPYIDRFKTDGRAEILPPETKYRDIFAESSLITTDYSSVAFDFAYLRKPIVYTQFQENHYEEGYFDYNRDGFGEVERDVESTVDRLIEYMENGCALKDEYRSRIDGFFAFDDKNNCRRVYEAIKNSEKK